MELLPNGDQALVDDTKLRAYALNPDHPLGGHKARVFASALGLTAADAHELEQALLSAARHNPATPGAADRFGQRYVVDFEMHRAGRRAVVRSAWIVRVGEDRPRLINCYIL
jgi:hypothetical protein